MSAPGSESYFKMWDDIIAAIGKMEYTDEEWADYIISRLEMDELLCESFTPSWSSSSETFFLNSETPKQGWKLL